MSTHIGQTANASAAAAEPHKENNMAYVTRSDVTSGWATIQPGNPSSTYAIVTGIISDLRTKIQPGNTINFSDITNLRGLLDYIKLHTHTYTNYEAISEFGNNGFTIGPTTSGISYGENTNGSFNLIINQNSPSGFVAGGTIYALHHNEFASHYNMLNSHCHTLNDTYYG